MLQFTNSLVTCVFFDIKSDTDFFAAVLYCCGSVPMSVSFVVAAEAFFNPAFRVMVFTCALPVHLGSE